MAQHWELQQWAVPRLGQLLPLTESELEQVVAQTTDLPDEAAEKHFHELLGDSEEAVRFRSEFMDRRREGGGETLMDMKGIDERSKADMESKSHAPGESQSPVAADTSAVEKGDAVPPTSGFKPPPMPPPSYSAGSNDSTGTNNSISTLKHTNAVIEAAKVRAKDEVRTTSAQEQCTSN
jgi:hypothetical protein